MNLRFRVLGQLYNVLPSAYDPAAAGVVIDKALVSLTVYVNDVLFFSTGIGTINNGTVFSGTIGGVASDFSIENTDYYKLNFALATPHDSAKIRLIVFVNNYQAYDNTFDVYGYDVGNNPNIAYPPIPAFPGNPDFEIIMAPTTFVPGGPDPSSTNIYPSPIFTVFRRPLDQAVQLVNLTSAAGDYYAYAESALIGSGRSFMITDEGNNLTTLKYVGLVAGWVPVPNYYADLPTSDDLNRVTETDESVPMQLTDFPDVTHEIITPGICDNDCDCIQDISEVRLTVFGLGSRPFVVDDLYIYGGYGTIYLNLTLKYASDGSVQHTTTQVINPDVNNPDYVAVYDYAIPNTIDFDRDYILQVDITDGTDVLDTKEFLLSPCTLSELVRSGCGSFLFENKSTDAILIIKSVAASGATTEVTNYTVDQGNSQVFDLADGVYIVEVVRNEVVQYSYKVFVYCTISRCIGEFIDLIGCKDPCLDLTEDCGCGGKNTTATVKGTKEILYDMTAFTLVALTYLQEVNAIYATNWVFTVLPDEELQHLKDLVILHDRLTKYCSGCS